MFRKGTRYFGFAYETKVDGSFPWEQAIIEDYSTVDRLHRNHRGGG